MSEPTELDVVRAAVAEQLGELRRLRKAYRSCRAACDDLDRDYMLEFKIWEQLQFKLARLEDRYHILPPARDGLKKRTQKVKEKAVLDLASSLSPDALSALIEQLSGELEKK